MKIPSSKLLLLILALVAFSVILARVSPGVLNNLSYAGLFNTREIEIKNKPTLLPPSVVNIEEEIQAGVSLLNSSPPLVYETKGQKPTGELVRRQIALAILDTSTGGIFEKRVWVDEQEIKNYKKTGVMIFEPAVLGETLDIQPQWWNSFNTIYEIRGHPEMIVVANKFLLQSSYLDGLPERSKSEFTDIIYIPYSKALHLPEVIEAGKQYLDKEVSQAFDRLESDKVVSRSSPGELATAVVSQGFIKNIILAEHIDPDSFSAAADGGKELTEYVLALLGVNRDMAYRYTSSPAGASGLAQFIKPTYQTIVSEYPDARLVRDYNLGMADHVNAIEAMVLFFDNYKKEIDNKVTRRDVIGQIGITEEMLAAAYNGGPNKVVKSVNKYGLAWLSGQFNLPSAAAVFKQETLDYVQKFVSVKNLSIF